MQTRDRISSLGFPTPPPAIADANDEYTERAADEYLSLKVQRSNPTSLYSKVHTSSSVTVTHVFFCQTIYVIQELDRGNQRAETEETQHKWEQQKMRDTEKEKDKEKELVKEKEQEKEQKQQLTWEQNVLEEKSKRPKDGETNRECTYASVKSTYAAIMAFYRMSTGWDKKKEEEDRKKTSSLLNQEEEENIRKRGHVQEEVKKWNQDALVNQQAAEEARRKKEQLLAKMREIDRQNQSAQDTMFAESSPSESSKEHRQHSPHPPSEQRNRNSSIFNLTQSEETASVRAGAGSREGGRRRSGIEGGALLTGIGRRALRPQNSSDDLAFGSYAPSFGNSATRGSTGFPPPPPVEDRDSALEAVGVFSLREMETEKEKEVEGGVGKDRKSDLMQQLFGALATPAGDLVRTSNKMEVLNSPPTMNGVHSRREGLLSFNSGSSTPLASSLNTLHVADSRPAIRAIASFDDDIEELTL